jgi:hypothetical protein
MMDREEAPSHRSMSFLTSSRIGQFTNPVATKDLQGQRAFLRPSRLRKAEYTVGRRLHRSENLMWSLRCSRCIARAAVKVSKLATRHSTADIR